MTRIEWTKERKAEFRVMWDRGDSVNRIGAHFKLCPETMQTYAWKFGFPQRQPIQGWTTKELAELARLRGLGMKRSAIALLMNRTGESIAGATRYHGLSKPRSKINVNDQERQRIKELLARGHSIEQIAKKLNRGPETIRRQTRLMGIVVVTDMCAVAKRRAASMKKKPNYLSSTAARWLQQREANAKIGWPPVTDTEARVLQAIINYGTPMTRDELGRVLNINTRTASGNYAPYLLEKLKSLTAKGYLVRIGKMPCSWIVAEWVTDQRTAYLKGGA